MSNQKIVQEAMALNQSALITMYVLDGSNQGADTYHFYPGTDPNGGDIVFQGQAYKQYPIEAKGFEMKSSGTYPTPEISFSNVYGFMSGLLLGFNDLIGCRIIRRRTFAKFLDGQPEADPTAQFPDDVFFVDRKIEESKLQCTLGLVSPIDVEDVSIPKRKIIGNLCQWAYRSAECSFGLSVCVARSDDSTIDGPQTFRSDVNGGLWTPGFNYAIGDVVFTIGFRGVRRYFRAFAANIDKRPPNAAYWDEDACSKRIKGCVLRFGGTYMRNNGLPFGGFPAVERLPF